MVRVPEMRPQLVYSAAYVVEHAYIVILVNMAASCTSNPTSEASEKTGKNRGKLWSDDATKTLIKVWGEEAIQVTLDNCKSSKQSSEVYKSLLVS
jgi:hypothetical protein